MARGGSHQAGLGGLQTKTYLCGRMARILAVDYGAKRCGLAVTDPLQIIVNGLETVPTENLLGYLQTYLANNPVEKLVVGLPVHRDGNYTYLKGTIDAFVRKFKESWPLVSVDFADEQFSSVRAREAILQSGAKKSQRQDKALVDKISAVIILQRYLNHI